MATRKRLSILQIQTGEPIAFDCFDSDGYLLLKKGAVLTSERTRDYFIERGLFATTEPVSISRVDAPEASHSPFQIFNNLRSNLIAIFAEAKKKQLAIKINHPDSETDLTNFDFTGQVTHIAGQVQKLCALNANAAIGIIHLISQSHYTIYHPLHRAIYCELVGSRYGFPDDERKRILCAALTCDVSMLDLQESLSRQPLLLTSEQQNAVRKHPADSTKLLQKFGVTDQNWLTAVTQHHENLCETGYPDGIPNKKITLWARLISLADSYTAMITPRPYKSVCPPTLAMQLLSKELTILYDEQMSRLSVKVLGLYPPGSFVQLANDEIAIVVSREDDSKTPQVKSVVGSRGALLNKPVLRDTRFKEFSIQDSLKPYSRVGADLHQLWD